MIYTTAQPHAEHLVIEHSVIMQPVFFAWLKYTLREQIPNTQLVRLARLPACPLLRDSPGEVLVLGQGARWMVAHSHTSTSTLVVRGMSPPATHHPARTRHTDCALPAPA